MARMPLSHTRCETYDACPFRFKRLYRDKIPQAKTHPMLVGGFFHAWADVYIQHLLNTKQASDYAVAERLFEEMWSKRSGHPEFYLLPEAKRDELYELMVTFRESHAFDIDTIAGSEVEIALTQEWEVTSWMAQDVFFRLKTDLLCVTQGEVGRLVSIWDFKTGYDVKTAGAVARDPQLRRYVLGVSAMMPADRFEVCLDFVRMNIQRKVEVGPEIAELAKKDVLAISDRVEASIQTGKWQATPGPGCAFCEVFDECPARKSAAPFRAPATPEQAGSLLDRLILIERESKDIKNALKSWGGQHGHVERNGMTYGPSLVESKDYDVKALMAWAQAANIDWGLVLKQADKSVIASAIKKSTNPKRAAADLAALPTEDRSFTAYRLKKTDDE